MTNTEWLLDKMPNPEDSSDLKELYDEFCTEMGHVSQESFSRYTRRAVQEYRESVEGLNSLEKDILDKDVLLDKLNETENKLELSLKSFKIQDVEIAAKVAGIDLSSWKCVGKRVRASQNAANPWFIVEGSFKPKEASDINHEDLFEIFHEMLNKHKIPTSAISPIKHKNEDNIAIFNFYDHHIGKRVQGDTTGNGKEWTVEEARKVMLEATDYFIDKIKDDVHKVWFVLGNDLLNFDNPAGTTTKGTPQHNDIDYKHLILESEDLLITVLEKLLYYFEIEVIVVPGNHDTNSVFFLGEVLRHYFKGNDSINIDNSIPLMKYKEFGEVAIGFVHGSEQINKKYILPMLMMQQRPDLAIKKFKEFHTGHFHQRKVTQMTEVSEDYGVTIRVLSTLTPSCEWSSNKGYIGLQATECLIYNRFHGQIASYRYVK